MPITRNEQKHEGEGFYPFQPPVVGDRSAPQPDDFVLPWMNEHRQIFVPWPSKEVPLQYDLKTIRVIILKGENMKASLKTFWNPLIIVIAASTSFAADSKNSKNKVPRNDTLITNESQNCPGGSEKITVYPAHDGFSFSRSQNASGKPKIYCNLNELQKQRKNLLEINAEKSSSENK